jgi:hypothetical protein
MSFDWLKGIRRLLPFGRATNGGGGRPDSDTLDDLLRRLVRLADQIEDHAERAPYPYIAERLRRIAKEKRLSVALLKDKLRLPAADGGGIEQDIQRGKNHWERMAQDLEEQKSFDASLHNLTLAAAEHTPDIAPLLEELARSQALHRDSLTDLLVRADPQAALD